MAVWPRTVSSSCRPYFLSRIKIHGGLLSVRDTISRQNWQIADEDIRALLIAGFSSLARFRSKSHCESIIFDGSHARAGCIKPPPPRGLIKRPRSAQKRAIRRFYLRTRELDHTLYLLPALNALDKLQNCPDKAAAPLRVTTAGDLTFGCLTYLILERAVTLITARLPEIFSPVSN